MIKTPTTKKNVNLPLTCPNLVNDMTLGPDLDAFYEQIKPDLDRLKRNPSAETINKILEFSRRK